MVILFNIKIPEWQYRPWTIVHGGCANVVSAMGRAWANPRVSVKTPLRSYRGGRSTKVVANDAERLGAPARDDGFEQRHFLESETAPDPNQSP